MNRLAVGTIAFCVAIALCYLGGAFSEADFNIAHWNGLTRSMCVLCMVITAPAAFCTMFAEVR